MGTFSEHRPRGAALPPLGYRFRVGHNPRTHEESAAPYRSDLSLCFAPGAATPTGNLIRESFKAEGPHDLVFICAQRGDSQGGVGETGKTGGAKVAEGEAAERAALRVISDPGAPGCSPKGNDP